MEGARGPLWWVEAGAALLSLEASADTMVKDAGCRLLDADEASLVPTQKSVLETE